MITWQANPGKLTATPHLKRRAARALYGKGEQFIIAALLLREKKGNEYVVLHLLCQGIEIVLKALLLLRDFDKYKPLILEFRYRHNLMQLVSLALTEYKLHPLRPAVLSELDNLNGFYKSHLLRYESVFDVVVDPISIPSAHALRWACVVMRLARRELRRLAP